jgi:hypothetical protein
VVQIQLAVQKNRSNYQRLARTIQLMVQKNRERFFLLNSTKSESAPSSRAVCCSMGSSYCTDDLVRTVNAFTLIRDALLGGWSRTLLLLSFGARDFSAIGFAKHSSYSANRMAESSCSLNDKSSPDFEDYVRLKSNNGFEFIFPATTLVDASSTVRAMLSGGSFHGSKGIISVPTSRALRGNCEFPASASSGLAASIVSSAS